MPPRLSPIQPRSVARSAPHRRRVGHFRRQRRQLFGRGPASRPGQPPRSLCRTAASTARPSDRAARADPRAATAECRPPGSSPRAIRPAGRRARPSSNCNCNSATCRQRQARVQQRSRRHAHRLIRAARQRARGGAHRTLDQVECLSGIGFGGHHGQFGQGDLVIGILCQESRRGGLAAASC